MILTNVKFTKVFKGKSGEGQYGPWQIWDCYINIEEWKDTKLSFFESNKNPTPVQGMTATVVEIEEQVKGEYVNYVIKNIETKVQAPVPKPRPQVTKENSTEPNHNNNHQASFYVSYAKDIAVALIEKGYDLEGIKYCLPEICRLVVESGLGMLDDILFRIPNKAIEPPKKPAPPPDNGMPENAMPPAEAYQNDDDIPF